MFDCSTFRLSPYSVMENTKRFERFNVGSTPAKGICSCGGTVYTFALAHVVEWLTHQIQNLTLLEHEGSTPSMGIWVRGVNG